MSNIDGFPDYVLAEQHPDSTDAPAQDSYVRRLDEAAGQDPAGEAHADFQLGNASSEAIPDEVEPKPTDNPSASRQLGQAAFSGAADSSNVAPYRTPENSRKDRGLELWAPPETSHEKFMPEVDHVFNEARQSLRDKPSTQLTQQEQKELSGEVPADGTTLLLVAEALATKPEKDSPPIAEVEQKKDTDTSLAAQIAENPQKLQDMIEREKETPTGFGKEVQEADVEGYEELFSRYQKEGHFGLWKSLERTPKETGFRRDSRQGGKFVKSDAMNLRSLGTVYRQHMQVERPISNGSGGKWSRQEGYSLIWRERIALLDREYTERHPSELCSPITLERGMRLAATHYPFRVGKDDESSDKLTLDSDPHRPSAELPITDIKKTADGLKVDVLKRTIELMKENQQRGEHSTNPDKHTQSGERQPLAEPIRHLEALRIAVQTKVELEYNGAKRAAVAMGLEVSTFVSEQSTETEARKYSSDFSALLRGELADISDVEIISLVQSTAASSKIIAQAAGPEMARQLEVQTIRTITDQFRGLESARSGASVEGGSVIPAEIFARMGTEALEEMRKTFTDKLINDHWQFGVNSGPTHPLRQNLDRVHEELAARDGMGAGQLEADRSTAASQDAQAELARRRTAERGVHIAIGPGGSAIPLATVIAALGPGTVDTVTTEGEELSPSVRSFLQTLSQQQNPTGRGVQFQAQGPYTPRNVQNRLNILIGPAALGLSPEHIFTQTPPGGASIIEVQPNVNSSHTGFADRLLQLLNDPQSPWHEKYTYEIVDSAQLTMHPYNVGEPQTIMCIYRREDSNTSS